MYLGKTLFAQVMDFLPWKTFHRIVDRYGGDHRTRSLSCAEQVSRHGIRTADIPRELARNRSVFWRLGPASSITWASARRL
jgi:Domain of unknown function (DUF4372)